MRILFISRDLIAGNLALLLSKEGHEVKLYIWEKMSKDCFDGLVEKTANWKNELGWVGKDGLIVFDDVGYGKIQDGLRKSGYTVFGGNALADRIELNREFGHDIFNQYGLKTVPLKSFRGARSAIEYVQSQKKAWVLKNNNNHHKFFNYVGHFSDGRDTIGVLENFAVNKSIRNKIITLQERIDGVEIGVGRYFNGTDWVGPIEYNVEHTKFFPGDLGPTTNELGTLAWFDTDEDNMLYKEFSKLKPFLQKTGFKGDFSINFIVNEKGAFPLEPTARLGTPISHLHSEMFESPWGEFMYAIAKGEPYDLKWKKGYGVVLLIAVPPFPYAKKMSTDFLKGMHIYFDKVTKDEMKHIHFEEVSVKKYDGKDQYYIADHQGYIMYVTSNEKTISEARNSANTLAEKIFIPKMLYRRDIGERFENEGLPLLKKLGYF